MNTDHEGSMIFSNLFNTDFIARPFVRQSVMCPWFYLHAEVREGEEFVGEMFMIPSFDSLKDILDQQHDSFRVQTIHYVTPGFVNETGEWRMEPLLEASEVTYQSGERIPVFKVPDRTYSPVDVALQVRATGVRILFRQKVDTKD